MKKTCAEEESKVWITRREQINTPKESVIAMRLR